MSSSSSEEVLSTSSDHSSVSLHDGDRSEPTSGNRPPSTASEAKLVQTLKDLQISYNQLESQYLKSVYELECQFHEKYSRLFEQRAQVIGGKHEPNDDECRLKTDFLETIEQQPLSDNVLGVPSFWLQTLKQAPMIADMIEEWDEPLITCLSDIKLRLHLQPIVGFTLEFHFDEQAKQFFSNERLTKFYELQIDPDEQVLLYEGTAIIHSEGCQIDWTDSTNNVTRHGTTGERRASFFNFFTSPAADDEWKSATDFQLGHYIRENIIPKAILYYTGEIFDEYDFSDEDMNEQQTSAIEQFGEGEHL